jgi:hypothetical protein
MKLVHWLNLIGIGSAAALITYLAMQWAITSYAAPTCWSYAESQGMTYVGYEPEYDTYSSGSQVLREGDCTLLAADGSAKIVSLVKAGGKPGGAPILVSLAMQWELVFGASFVGVAFSLAMILRVFKPKTESAA